MHVVLPLVGRSSHDPHRRRSVSRTPFPPRTRKCTPAQVTSSSSIWWKHRFEACWTSIRSTTWPVCSADRCLPSVPSVVSLVLCVLWHPVNDVLQPRFHKLGLLSRVCLMILGAFHGRALIISGATRSHPVAMPRFIEALTCSRCAMSNRGGRLHSSFAAREADSSIVDSARILFDSYLSSAYRLSSSV